MSKPSLTFFCEMETSKLTELFAGSKVVNYLAKLDANLSLGLLDLSAERAEVIKKLNKAGIPVTAWILLPKEQGYWTSLDTITETRQRYIEFKNWATKHKLRFAAIGLDIEPRIQVMTALNQDPFRQILRLIKRFFFETRLKNSELAAKALIQTIHEDDYPVETYQFPTVLDERAVGSKFFAKTLGLPSLPSDREVLMLYTSFFKIYPDSILWSYAQECQAAGIGSTGGGVEIEGVPPLKTLRWIDLKRDLLLANLSVRHIYIFSLEGCMANNFMDRLVNLDWDTQVIPPSRSATGITVIRKVGQGFLWALAHPLEVLSALIVGTVIIKKINRFLSRN